MAYSQILTKKDVQVRKEVETEMIKNAELKKVLIDLTFDLNEIKVLIQQRVLLKSYTVMSK